MLWFVTTRDKEYPEQGSQFWIALANTPAELVEMFEDDYTELIDFSDNVPEGLIQQYGGVALLSTP